MRKSGIVLLAGIPVLSLVFAVLPAMAQNSDEAELNDLIKTQSSQLSGLTGGGGGNGGSGSLGSQLQNMGGGNMPGGFGSSGFGSGSSGFGSPSSFGSSGSFASPSSATSIDSSSAALGKLDTGALSKGGSFGGTSARTGGFGSSIGGSALGAGGAPSPGNIDLPGLDSLPKDFPKQVTDHNNQIKQLLDTP